MPPLRQAIWWNIWKHTVEKSRTNATNVTLHLLTQAIWGHIWKHTLEKSETNATNAMECTYYENTHAMQCMYTCYAMHVESTLWMLNLDLLNKCNIRNFLCSLSELYGISWFFQVTILITRLLETDQGHLKMGSFDRNCQKCPYPGAEKWDFKCPNPKKETTFSRQHPLKMVE